MDPLHEKMDVDIKMKKLIYFIYLPIGIFGFLISLPLVIISLPIIKYLFKVMLSENDTITLREFIPYWLYLHTDYDHIVESFDILINKK
jgi:hypothetical protein